MERLFERTAFFVVDMVDVPLLRSGNNGFCWCY